MRRAERLPLVREVSAGGVVFRRGSDGVEVCLIATRGHSRWQLPKGEVEQGETAEMAARREVREETGLVASVLEPLKVTQYWYIWGEGEECSRHHKRVHFFLLRCEGGDVSAHDGEVDEARWFPIDEAITRATFANERAVLRKAREKVAAGAAAPGTP